MKLIGRSRRQPTAELLGSAGQVALIGEQGVAGGAGFGRHHFQKGRDQSAIVRRAHKRAIASAAIILASNSSPTARNALRIRNRCAGGTPYQSSVCMPDAA